MIRNTGRARTEAGNLIYYRAAAGESRALTGGQGLGARGWGKDQGSQKNGPGLYKWLIRLATFAAPKPLSMFTTDTPDAQLLIMPSSAAMPPKLAPYPTLVGTAMTGTLTSPAMTLGSAPSIPATTMITR